MQTFKITVQDDNFATHLLQLLQNMNFVSVEIDTEDDEDEYLSLLATEAKNDVFHDWEDVKRELLTK